jgi:flagellar hook-associated protein 2
MSSVSSLGGSLNFTGLASGIDTSKIIDGLTSLTQQQISSLQTRKDALTHKQTTFNSLEAQLLDLQTQVGRLARSVSGAFDGRTATSSNTDVLTASASSSAQPGTYSLEVQALAQAQQVASSGVTDLNATLKQGTVQIRVGTRATTTVTIDSSNNTLQGLANAINGAGGDVRAAVINDGSASPYRLLLSSTKTGAANTIQVTNNLTGGDGAAPDLAQTTLQAASDARVALGSGTGAITVTSATNRLDSLIAGVTVNLAKAAPGQSVTLSVGNDTGTAKQALEDFVSSYNAVVTYVGDRSTYDSKTNTAGELLGNKDATDLVNGLANALGSAVGGVNAKANRLAAIGLTFKDDGELQIDETKLDQALGGQLPGVSIGDFRRLFGLTGSSTAPGVSFLLGGNKTQPTGDSPYRVDVTRAATAAALTATAALTDPVSIDGSNNSFSIKVNGLTSSLLTLDPGDYRPADLAAALQAKINADAALAGNQVVVDLDGGKLRFRSQVLGSASKIAFTGGTALGASDPFKVAGSAPATGADVAGSFLVNGTPESATGSGQVLSGRSGNAHTDGLSVRVTLDPSQVVDGPEADLTVTQGLASRLNQVLNRYLDPINGRLKTVNDQFQNQSDDIDKTITHQNDLLDAKKNQLIAQFTAMETTISQLQTLGNQLSAQFGTTNQTSKL